MLKHHLLTLLATTLVAGSFIVSQTLAPLIHPLSLTLLRFLGASLILLPIVLSQKKWRRTILTTLPKAMIISLFYAIFFVAHFASLQLTSALHTAALFTLVPFLTAILSIMIWKETLNLQKLSAYALGIIGSCLILFSNNIEDFLAFHINEGDALFMIAVLSMSLYGIARKFFYQDESMIVLVFGTLLGGAVWIFIALLFTNQALDWQLLEKEAWLQMAYLIIAATLMTVYIYQKSTVALGASRVSAYIYLTPALIVLIRFITDGVEFSLPILLGIIFSSLATILLQKNP